MKIPLLSLFFYIFWNFSLNAQDKPIEYYLDTQNFDKSIPTPKDFFGWQIGDWHLNHDQLMNYCKKLAETSPKITYYEYGRSYEQRPLFYLIITSEKNHTNLETIRKTQLQMCDPESSSSYNIDDKKIIIYQGFSVHGNEASGGNAAALAAYQLAASKDSEVKERLDKMVILLDPCFNPDGFHRFSTWVNSHKSMNLHSDRNGREFNEVFPKGRTNHYWFDLNRDWLPGQHPESQGRIREFYRWRPTILTDHHEMGSDRTFFFQPGVPSRTNPLTPEMNQILTEEIGKFHAKELDKIGSLYYSRDGFDDFYYGKGSTFPDALGSIGILFEQASSRGHLQETENGNLSFPFTIRNQIKTIISTQKAAYHLRKELLTYQRDFFVKNKKNEKGGYVFSPKSDTKIIRPFLKMLLQQNIKVHRLNSDLKIKKEVYKNSEAYYVPVNQAQSRLIRSMFEKNTVFKDSLFYDVSTWNMPLAFNLNFDFVKKISSHKLGDIVSKITPDPEAKFEKSEYAYLIDGTDYYTAKALNIILKSGVNAKVAAKPFLLEGINYPIGTIVIACKNQPRSANSVHEVLKKAAKVSGIKITPVSSGYTSKGIDLGSYYFQKIKLPGIIMPVGEGTSSYGAGEVWHLLDQRFDMNVTMVDKNRFNNINLQRYNVLVLPDGNYGDIQTQIKEFVQSGGTLIAIGRATKWLADTGWSGLKTQRSPDSDSLNARRAYKNIEGDTRKHSIRGTIVGGNMDLTHPLAFGYNDSDIALFKTNAAGYEMPKNKYSVPIRYTENPQISGYMSDENRDLLKNSPAVIVSKIGRGRIVSFADNPLFRAYWYGTNKLFMNAVFYGNLISSEAAE